MATWRKVIVSGSQASLAAVTASIQLQVGTNQVITTSPATTYLSGSFSGSFTGNGANLTGIVASTATNATNAASSSILDNQTGAGPYYLTFVDGSGNKPIYIDTSTLTYNATTNGITATSFTGSLFGTASNASNVSWTGISNIPTGFISSSALSAGASQGQITYVSNSLSNTITVTSLGTTDSPQFANLTLTSNLTVGGNLTVNGNTSVINTTNLEVKDSFILLASGSATAGQDGGIIVQYSGTIGTGSVFYWDGSDNRWAVTPSGSTLMTSLTPNSYLVTVSGSAGNPSNSPYYGDGANKSIGNMYVNSDDSSIWIWA